MGVLGGAISDGVDESLFYEGAFLGLFYSGSQIRFFRFIVDVYVTSVYSHMWKSVYSLLFYTTR